MADKKRQTWEVINPDGYYVIVRTMREARDIANEENDCLGVFEKHYWYRRGKSMTDAALKALPELDCF